MLFKRFLPAAILLVAVAFATGIPDVQAQERPDTVVLTLDEAVQIALVQNQTIRNSRLDLETAHAQVKEGWAELFPLIEASSSFTRNVRSVNPFSGSQAGGLFQSLGFLDWLAFNEEARTDSNPDTVPIPVGEFFTRQQQGLQAAGVNLDSGDNPFSVPNQYAAGISVTQKLFDGRALMGARGATKWLGPMNLAGISRDEQILVDQVRTAWYGTLLANERSRVLSQSVERAEMTLEEVSKQVSQGTAPKFQRLSAEVELTNMETEQIQAENQASLALDNLKLALGIDPDTQVRMRGSLENDASEQVATMDIEQAKMQAMNMRPDLDEVRIGIELERVQLRVARSEYMPNIDAFANLGYIGNVPDSRTSYSSVEGDPFTFTTSEYGYFSTAYWDWNFNVGFRMSWTLFNGLGTHRRIQQRKIALRQAEIGYEQLRYSVQVEVEGAVRDLRAARIRMTSQEQNVARAELNFSYAQKRLSEGVATPIEVREASDQLDQSRLNHLQAVHDFLIARSAWETALGEERYSTSVSER